MFSQVASYDSGQGPVTILSFTVVNSTFSGVHQHTGEFTSRVGDVFTISFSYTGTVNGTNTSLQLGLMYSARAEVLPAQDVDLVLAFDNSSLHKLIYRGQTLSVPLSVTSVGGSIAGTADIEYYLSRDQNPQIGNLDTHLTTLPNQALNLPTDQPVPLPATGVSIPTTIDEGTCF